MKTIIITLLLMFAAGPVLSAGHVTPEQADEICYFYALTLSDIAVLRDAGVAKEDIYHFIEKMQMPERDKALLKQDVDTIYANPNISPEYVAKAAYHYCMKDLLEVEI